MAAQSDQINTSSSIFCIICSRKTTPFSNGFSSRLKEATDLRQLKMGSGKMIKISKKLGRKSSS